MASIICKFDGLSLLVYKRTGCNYALCSVLCTNCSTMYAWLFVLKSETLYLAKYEIHPGFVIVSCMILITPYPGAAL